MRSICLGLAILFFCVFGAQAQVTNSPQVGGPLGGAFDDPCHGTDVLIGFNAVTGKALNTIAAVCQAQDNGVLVGANYGLHTWGDSTYNGGPFHALFGVRCSPGEAVFELHVTVNKFDEVDGVSALCTSLLRPNVGDYPRDNAGGTSTNGGQAVRDGPSGCPINAIAVGLTGRSGSLINSVGLKCSKFPWHLAFEPGPPPPPTLYIGVIATAQIFPTCGGNSAAKTINGNEVDLNKGQAQVQLIKIGPAGNCTNWYQLNWPGAPAGDNWVYSAPPPPPNTPPTDFTSLDQTTLAAAEAALGGGH
ncbi:MAG: hypothetical protein WB495_02535 [Xanthobacteraceae bacterium]